MDLLSIKLSKTEKGFRMTVETDDEELREEWKERILAFLSGECTCGCCGCCGGSCNCSCGDEEGKGESESCCK